MRDELLISFGYLTCAVIIAAVLAKFWRENDPPAEPVEATPLPPHEITLRVSLDLQSIERIGTMLTAVVSTDRGLQQVDHLHGLSEQAAERIEDLVRNVYVAIQRAQMEAPIRRAQPIQTPPDPESRIERDLRNAKAVIRGAEQLMIDARQRGVQMTQEEAMRQAADMLQTTISRNG